MEHKYINEIHANEVAILPYYIANLNIEYSYKERTGRYLQYPNLCFVDTLDNLDWEGQGATGGGVTRQSAFNLGGLSTDNWIRVQSQNEKRISVIIGNPPYNDSQSNWNEFNPNRQYSEIDRRIRDTYVKESTAQKTHQYDMYKRFLRWASDRLQDDGIIAFVTNRAYLDTRQDDGFRKIAAQEFTDIYVLDLGSDVRRNPKISGTTHNVFGIQTGVAIGFFVRDKSRLGQCTIQYARRKDNEHALDKLAYLDAVNLYDIGFHDLAPDQKNDWLDQSSSNYASLIPLTDRQTKLAKKSDEERSVYGLFANGVKTNRDEWVYDFDLPNLRGKASFFADTYNANFGHGEDSFDASIKWSRDLRNEFRRGHRIIYRSKNLKRSLYRPFVVKYHFVDFRMNDVLTRNHYAIFGSDLTQHNKVICVSGVASTKPFQVLGTDKLFGFDTLEKTQCLPLYRYAEDGERVSNITKRGLGQFREHYGDDGITAEDVFAYTYATLHDPLYRDMYALDLRQQLPCLPFHEDFQGFVGMGQELLDTHIAFESAEPWPLKRDDQTLALGNTPKVRLGANKERGAIILDEVTRLTGIPEIAWAYRLGNRSAIEWVLDQYKERKPRDPTIAERFNTYRFADHKERVIDLLRRVCTVSVRTMEIVDEIADRSSLG